MLDKKSMQQEVRIMTAMVKFIESDETLINAIKEYQRAHGLSSFTAAVRKLCGDAIIIEKIRH